MLQHGNQQSCRQQESVFCQEHMRFIPSDIFASVSFSGLMWRKVPCIGRLDDK